MTTLKEKISAKFEFDENCEAAFRYYADCNSNNLLETRDQFNEGRRYENFQLKSKVLPILLECAEALELVSKGHTIAKINFDYFHEDSKEEGMIKNEILVTPQTEQARQALERLRKWSESENIF